MTAVVIYTYNENKYGVSIEESGENGLNTELTEEMYFDNYDEALDYAKTLARDNELEIELN